MKPPRALHLEKTELDLASFIRRHAEEEDAPALIQGSTLVFDKMTNNLLMVYLELEEDCRDLQAALTRIHFEGYNRNMGMRSESRIFGASPRSLPRHDFCAAASLQREDPEAHALIASYAERVSRYYEQFNPDLYAEHEQITGEVLPEWKMGATAFTSGIINHNASLEYHYDAGNFKGVWSNMLVFKDGIQGGRLALPELGIRFNLPNNSLLMFDGQGLLHGVTPIILERPDAARYSVVYYSLKQMWKCLPITEEIARAGKRRADRERRRRHGEHSADIVAKATRQNEP